MIHKESWDHSFLIVRSEILGFVKHEPLSKNVFIDQERGSTKTSCRQQGKNLLDFHIFVTNAVRWNVCDVVLSSTRQHDEPVDASTQEHREELSNQPFIGFLC